VNGIYWFKLPNIFFEDVDQVWFVEFCLVSLSDTALFISQHLVPSIKIPNNKPCEETTPLVHLNEQKDSLFSSLFLSGPSSFCHRRSISLNVTSETSIASGNVGEVFTIGSLFVESTQFIILAKILVRFKNTK